MTQAASPLLALLAAALLAAAAPAAAEELRLLSYNTHGIPGWASGDAPERRFPQIGQLTNDYDLVLLQEDFDYHDRLRLGTRQPLVARGNGSRGCAWCRSSGLTLLLDLPERALRALHNAAYRDCAGWLGGGNDCWASKGFQLLRLRLPGGAELHVANTHLDAGLAPADREARAAQLRELERAIARRVGDGALVVAGDLNLERGHPADEALLDRFVRRVGLRDSGARGASERWRIHVDYVLFRSGEGARLEVRAAGEDERFVEGGEPLSDHPALFATFAVTPPSGLLRGGEAAIHRENGARHVGAGP